MTTSRCRLRIMPSRRRRCKRTYSSSKRFLSILFPWTCSWILQLFFIWIRFVAQPRSIKIFEEIGNIPSVDRICNAIQLYLVPTPVTSPPDDDADNKREKKKPEEILATALECIIEGCFLFQDSSYLFLGENDSDSEIVLKLVWAGLDFWTVPYIGTEMIRLTDMIMHGFVSVSCPESCILQ